MSWQVKKGEYDFYREPECQNESLDGMFCLDFRQSFQSHEL